MGTRCVVPLLAVALACVVAFAPASSAVGDDSGDYVRCSDAIARSADPVERFRAVRRLAELADDRVPGRLARLVRTDADPGLRLEAVHALATTPSKFADRTVIELIAGGGPREIREGLATVLRERGVALARIVAELDTQKREPIARCRLTDALAAYPDLLAAGHLERLARLWSGPTRDAALRALERHPQGGRLLPDVIAELLGSCDDVDSLVALLDAAERFGDDRVARHENRLRKLGLPAVDAAFDLAVAHVAERNLLRSGGLPAKPARVRDRVDRVHVAHQGRDLQKVWDAVRADLLDARLAFEDVRVACELYLEPSANRPVSSRNRLLFTRSVDKVDAFFGDILFQTKRGTGVGMTEAIESAFDLPSWRWDAQRTVVLYADAAPVNSARAVIPASIHRVMDGTALKVFFFAKDPKDVPRKVRDVADSGATDVNVVPPVSRGDTGGGGDPDGPKGGSAPGADDGGRPHSSDAPGGRGKR